MWHAYHRTGHDLEEAQRLFALARDADPQLSPAHAGAAEAYFFQTVGGFAASIEDNKANAIRLGRRAVELDGKDAFAHYALGRALTLARQPDGAIAELETAIELNPSCAQAYFALGFVFSHFGRAEEPVVHFHSAMRLSPQDPYFGQFLIHLSSAMLYQGRFILDGKPDTFRQSPDPIVQQFITGQPEGPMEI